MHNEHTLLEPHQQQMLRDAAAEKTRCWLEIVENRAKELNNNINSAIEEIWRESPDKFHFADTLQTRKFADQPAGCTSKPRGCAACRDDPERSCTQFFDDDYWELKEVPSWLKHWFYE